MAKFIKTIKKDDEARDKLLKGVNLLADAVGSTLGPRSRNVAVDRVPDSDMPPIVLHDGVSVARSINVKDPHEDMGIRLLKGASLKTNEVAGDGTTGSTIIAQALINEAFKQIGAGANPMVLKEELERDTKRVLEILKNTAKPIKDKDYKDIASISAGDNEIGKLVAEVLQKVGKDGVVTVEAGQSFETTSEFKEGMTIDKGYLSSYFQTDQETETADIKNPFILLTDKKINYANEIMPFLEKFVKAGQKDLVIFAGEVVEEGLSTLVINKMRGAVNVIAVQAPAFGNRRIDELQDIASFTGGQVILEEQGKELKDVEIEELGRAKRVLADMNSTKIFEGSGNPAQRISDIEAQIKTATTPYDEEIRKIRLGNLTGRIAVINVGGKTEVEVNEKKERVIDAVSALRAAIEEGIVAGGEITLLLLAKNTDNKLLAHALEAPFKKLLENSGLDAMLVSKLEKYPQGIDVRNGGVADLLKVGIIDPAKVTRSAIENAVSVASMAMTTNYLIADDLPNE